LAALIAFSSVPDVFFSLFRHYQFGAEWVVVVKVVFGFGSAGVVEVVVVVVIEVVDVEIVAAVGDVEIQIVNNF